MLDKASESRVESAATVHRRMKSKVAGFQRWYRLGRSERAFLNRAPFRIRPGRTCDVLVLNITTLVRRVVDISRLRLRLLGGPLDPSTLRGILILKLGGVVHLLRLVCGREEMSGRGALMLLFGRMISLSGVLITLLRLRRSGVDALE